MKDKRKPQIRKNVYLFELDSVRKTDEEIEVAQNALLDEIVLNGNVVVMTYNQLVDSRGFFSLLCNEKYEPGNHQTDPCLWNRAGGRIPANSQPSCSCSWNTWKCL